MYGNSILHSGKTGCVRIGLHSRFLCPSATVALLADQFPDDRCRVFRSDLQFVRESQQKDFVFALLVDRAGASFRRFADAEPFGQLPLLLLGSRL